jgi:excisionase family DNA binding protein
MNAKEIDHNAVVSVRDVLAYLQNDCYLDKGRSAKYLGVSVRCFEGWMDQLPKYRPGGKALFKKSDLDEFMRRHVEPPTDIDLERLADDAVAAVLR